MKGAGEPAVVVLLSLALVVVGCPSEPRHAGESDPLADLARAVEHAERVAPVAAASCGLVPEDRRSACSEGARVLALAAEEGREVLRVAERCREEQDADCVALAVERAAELVRVLR